MTPPTENASRHQQSQGPLDVPLEAEPVDLFSGPLWIQAEQLSWVSETTDEILASEIMESFVNNLLNHGIKLDCQAFRLPFILVQGSIASKIRIVALSQHLEQQSKEQQNMSIHAVPENGYEGEVIRIGITIKDTPLSKDPRRFLEHILNTRPLSIDITEEGVVVAVQYLYHARTNPISLSRRAGQHLKDLQALFPRSFPGSIKVTGYDLIGLTKVDPPTFHSGSQLHRWPFPNPSESASSNPAARSNVRPAPSNPAARSNVRTAPSTTAGLRERLNSSSLQPTGEKRARVDDDDDDDDEGQSVKLTSAAMLRGRASQLEKQARTWGEAAKLYEQSAMMVDEANKLCKQADQKLEGL